MAAFMKRRTLLSIVLAFCMMVNVLPGISFAASNLALNKPVTVSSTFGSGYGGAKAVDGNAVTTSWVSAVAEASSWIYVNLGSSQSIDKVVIKWPQYTYATAFQIQTSPNAAAWTNRYSTSSGAGGTTTATFAPVSAQYVRVLMTAKADVNYEIFELEVYGEGGGTGDTVAPTAPTGLASPSKTASSVNLSWNASTDNVGVTGYTVYRNGTNPVNATGTSATIGGLSASTTYVFTVKAKDAAGNESAASNSLSVTTNASGGCTSGCQLENAAFLDSAWFSTAQSAANIATYVNELAAHKIKYQFADVGLLVDSNTITNGTLPAAGYAGLAQWIKNSKQTDPNQKVIVNINYSKRAPRNAQNVKVPNPNFGTATFNTNVNAVINTLLNVGLQINGTGPYYKADGVHLDWEGFVVDDQPLKATLQYLRNNAVGSNAYFSMSTPVDPSIGGVYDYVWSNTYINQLAGILNMMNPMMYDTMWGSDVVNAATYRKFMKDEISRYSTAIGNTGPGGGARSQLVPTLPSYESNESHNPSVESMANAITGMNQARSDGANVFGAGIFWWSAFIGRNPSVYTSSYFTADQSNWLTNWVNNPQ